MAGMSHSLKELNDYTGALTGGCLICLFFCSRTLADIAKVVALWYLDYRKVNSLDGREEAEREARYDL